MIGKLFLKGGNIMNQRKVIHPSVSKIKIFLDNTDILLGAGLEKQSSIVYQGDIETTIDDGVLLIGKKQKNYTTIVSDGGNEIFVKDQDGFETTSYQGGIIEDKSRKTILNHGDVLSMNQGMLDKSKTQNIKLILSKDKKYDFVIVTEKGTIFGQQVKFNNLDIRTQTGNIKLIDINSENSYLQTNSGDITLTVLETLENYRSILKTVSGNIQQRTIDYDPTESIKFKKYRLEASSKYGNINVVFQGKQK